MSEPFYARGLRFECTRCSRCCRHDPGYVFLTYDDLYRLLRVTGLDEDLFIEKYCTTVDMRGIRRLSLKEKQNFDCIFWEEGGCTVYEDRPLQCRSYPFWTTYLHSEETWLEAGEECPGVNNGRVRSYEEIQAWIDAREKASFIVES